MPWWTKEVRGTPKGIRTPVAAVRGRCPRPLDHGGIGCGIRIRTLTIRVRVVGATVTPFRNIPGFTDNHSRKPVCCQAKFVPRSAVNPQNEHPSLDRRPPLAVALPSPGIGFHRRGHDIAQRNFSAIQFMVPWVLLQGANAHSRIIGGINWARTNDLYDVNVTL